MRIRGWLTGLIVFLLAPSLLFAWLWFHNKFENVSAIDRSLDGLHLVAALGPLMQEKALTGQIQTPPSHLRDRIAAFGEPDRSAELTADLDDFFDEENVPMALEKARHLALSISHLVKLDSITSYETSKFPHLISNTLLSVAIESSIMASSARSLSNKSTVNVWDKMLIPVQGGQFKVAADHVSRTTVEFFDQLKGPGADLLRARARHYRVSNINYQAQGSRLLSSTIRAKTGAGVVSQPLIAAQPELLKAAFMLWQSALDYLDKDLQRQRAEMLFAVLLAGLVGGLVIIAAFVIAIALTRALADRTQQEFESLGFHDPLTGLPNRRALLKAIKALPEQAPDTRAGLMLIDLHQFKKINDRFGDQNGDSILRDIAEQLTRLAEPEDFVSRTGGTEFVLLRPRLTDAPGFEQLAARLIQAFAKDRFANEQKATIESSIGLLISQKGERITNQALTDAALALRSAKQKGSRTFDLFTADMRTAFEKHGEIAKDLLKALNEGDIVPWYQPQVDVHTGEIVGAEALVRWIENDQVRYPGTFLPAAVEAGYMDRIDSAVRQNAIRLAINLNGKTRNKFLIGLNVSASLLSSADAVDALNRQVRDMGLDPSSVSLEILEAVMIDEITAMPIKENIARLSGLGFHIELDDFGTGHSSISSLRDLKVDRVKIDRSFVFGVDKNPGLQKFTSALINLAKSLDISVLAEGVETEGERQWLSDNGCDVIQGFLLSRAVPEEQLAAQILKQNFAVPRAVPEPRQVLRS